MNLKLFDKAYRIGKSRFMAEVSPMFRVKKDDSCESYPLGVKPDFIRRHKDDMDAFLLNNGYLNVESYEENDSEYTYSHSVSRDDPYDDVTPNIDSFVSHLRDTLEGNNKDNGSQAYIITQMLYRDLYNEDDRETILVHKIRYLCDIMTKIFEIEYFENGYDTDIDIIGIKEKAVSAKLRSVEDMIFDVGYLPNTTKDISNYSFITYLEEYINGGYYLRDGFTFGETVLAAYDRHIQRIDWYDHEYYFSLLPPVTENPPLAIRGIVI